LKLCEIPNGSLGAWENGKVASIDHKINYEIFAITGTYLLQ